jgi:hypothetical protein
MTSGKTDAYNSPFISLNLRGPDLDAIRTATDGMVDVHPPESFGRPHELDGDLGGPITDAAFLAEPILKPAPSDLPNLPVPPSPPTPPTAPPPSALFYALSDAKRIKSMNRVQLAELLKLEGDAPWPDDVPKIPPSTADDNSLEPFKQFLTTTMYTLEADAHRVRATDYVADLRHLTSTFVGSLEQYRLDLTAATHFAASTTTGPSYTHTLTAPTPNQYRSKAEQRPPSPTYDRPTALALLASHASITSTSMTLQRPNITWFPDLMLYALESTVKADQKAVVEVSQLLGIPFDSALQARTCEVLALWQTDVGEQLSHIRLLAPAFIHAALAPQSQYDNKLDARFLLKDISKFRVVTASYGDPQDPQEVFNGDELLNLFRTLVEDARLLGIHLDFTALLESFFGANGPLASSSCIRRDAAHAWVTLVSRVKSGSYGTAAAEDDDEITQADLIAALEHENVRCARVIQKFNATRPSCYPPANPPTATVPPTSFANSLTSPSPSPKPTPPTATAPPPPAPPPSASIRRSGGGGGGGGGVKQPQRASRCYVMADGAIQWTCPNPKCSSVHHNTNDRLDPACQSLQPLKSVFESVLSKSTNRSPSALGTIPRKSHACFEGHLLARGCTKGAYCQFGHDLDPIKDFDEQRRTALVHMTSNRIHAVELNMDACRAWGIGYDDLSPSLQARHTDMKDAPSVPRHLLKDTNTATVTATAITATANSLTFAEGDIVKEHFFKTYADRPSLLDNFNNASSTEKMKALYAHKRDVIDA